MHGYNDSGYGYGYGAYSPELQGSMNVPAALPVAIEFLDNYIIAGSPSFEIGVPDLDIPFRQENPLGQARMNEALQRPNTPFRRNLERIQRDYGSILRGV
jgi:hypothetical protein